MDPFKCYYGGTDLGSGPGHDVRLKAIEERAELHKHRLAQIQAQTQLLERHLHLGHLAFALDAFVQSDLQEMSNNNISGVVGFQIEQVSTIPTDKLMLCVLSKRNILSALKVVQWASPLYKSGTSAFSITYASGFGMAKSWEPCCAMSTVVYLKHNNTALAKHQTLAVKNLVCSVLFQQTQFFHGSAVRLKKRPQSEPPPKELDLLRYDMKHFWRSPKPALYLGLAGLIPFVSPPLLMAVTETYFPELAYIQVAYGASILSFLGGARWGFTLPESSPAKPDWINLANSVVPSLLAVMAMLLSNSITPAATIVIMGLGISLHYDLSLLPTYPSWLKALCSVVTIVAFFSLVCTLIMDGVFPREEDFFRIINRFRKD